MQTADIAQQLRQIDTVAEGAVFLKQQNPTKADLVAIAGHLGLSRVSQLSRDALQQRILQQAIGARRKFSGLWAG